MAETLSPVYPPEFGAALPTGKLIAGRYVVRGVLGWGGMGVVYEALDRELGETIALKLLRSDRTDSPEMIERFRMEVRLARRVTHRNVARTYDIGDDDGLRFITMELVKGEALSNLLDRQGHLEVERALPIAIQIASGMAAAREAGVVHRDLKPENVTIAGDGRVVIMDFGIASTVLVPDASAAAGAWGTPAYMSPEQVTGEPAIDARADVYAFGAVLYEMLTGQAAWSAATPLLVATARLTFGPPDARTLLPDLPEAIAALVTTCMAREPSGRFVDGATLLRALESLVSPERSLHVHASWPPASTLSRVPESTPTLPSSRADLPWTELHGRIGASGLLDDLRAQLTLMGVASPSHRRLVEQWIALVTSEVGAPILARLAGAWQRRSFAGAYERPLLLLAALRSDAMAEGASHPLYEALASDTPNPDAITREALLASLSTDHIGLWIRLRGGRIQTNEVSRSIAWLWTASLVGCGGRARSLLLADLGCSAGLNLVADRVAVTWTCADGSMLDFDRDLDVRARLGFDARPLDALLPTDRAWLRACVWPGQTERLTRLDEAFAAFARAVPAVELNVVQAASIPQRLADVTRTRPTDVAIAYQTLLRDYLPRDDAAAYDAGMRRWLVDGEVGRRLWVELELSGRDPTWPCALDVHVNEGGEVVTIRLGQMGYHPTRVRVDADAELRLRAISRA